jgi:hypothetical protein
MARRHTVERKMNPFTIFTLSGPVIGGAGFLFGWLWLFWIGIGLALINLVLNLASGVMKAPLLPMAFMFGGAFLYDSVMIGGGLGLLAWTLLEGIGEIFGIARSK